MTSRWTFRTSDSPPAFRTSKLSMEDRLRGARYRSLDTSILARRGAAVRLRASAFERSPSAFLPKMGRRTNVTRPPLPAPPFRAPCDATLSRVVEAVRSALDPDAVELEVRFLPERLRYRRRFLRR